MEITNGSGVNRIFDCVGGKITNELFDAAAANCKIFIYGRFNPESSEFNNSFILSKGLTIRGFFVRSYIEGMSIIKKNRMTQSLVKLMNEDSFKMNVAATYALEDFREAISAYARSGRNGKIIFKI